jgi:hypothetical protein
VSFKRVALIIVLSWLAMIGVDFLLHGGVLAKFYVRPSPFLLPPKKALQLIPLGYLSFLLLAVLLVSLMNRLNVQGWRAGAVFGLKLGALLWGTVVLGLVSISTASVWLLLGWFLGQTGELPFYQGRDTKPPLGVDYGCVAEHRSGTDHSCLSGARRLNLLTADRNHRVFIC